jgi:hypothetical protein
LIFLQPQFRNQQGEIINVVDSHGKAIGYLAYLYQGESDLYIMGQLNNPGEKQNFIDIISKYIDGLKNSILGDGETEPNLFIHLGGEVIDIDNDCEEQNQ